MKNERRLRTVFLVQAMDCSDELRVIERRLRQLPSITDLQANLIAHTLTVVHDEILPAARIQKEIRKAGFEAVLHEETAQGGFEENAVSRWWPHNGRALATLISGVLLAVAAALHFIVHAPPAAVDATLLLAIAAGGLKLFRSGVKAALRFSPDMTLLMTIAIIGSIVIGHLSEGASVVFLFSLAQWLESRTVDRARDSIRKLLDLSPREAVVVRDGRQEHVTVEAVAPGETLVIRPGERIPLDGEVIDGTSEVDESPVTGESMPVEKQVGSTVFAGSVNQHGSLVIRATKRWSDTALAKVIHMVEEAQSRRAPTQQFVDKFARWYTPAVIAGAALLVIIPTLQHAPFSVWFYKALVLLVIACPCALVISTPVTIICALARAARSGVLIKGGAHLENVGKLDTIIFDKTGTLTQGKAEVVDVLPLNNVPPREILRAAAAVESHSEHHLARAVLHKAKAEGIEPPAISNFSALPGRGARADLDGQTFFVGNPRLFQELGADTSVVEPRLQQLELEGKAVVLVGRADLLMGALVLADVIRPNAPGALHRLRSVGIDDFIMLTGDNEGTARAIATQLGMDHYHAGLLPQDKVREVQETLAERKLAAMVGDGVNDAPALAASTVGIAMGTAGTDAALETADIALMADDLDKLAYTVSLGRKAVAIIRQNVGLALLIKAAFITLAVAGAATLWSAVAADMGASLLVILNGMRLLHYEDKHETTCPGCRKSEGRGPEVKLECCVDTENRKNR